MRDKKRFAWGKGDFIIENTKEEPYSSRRIGGKPSVRARLFSDVLKFNPYHDSRGRFASKPGGTAAPSPSGSAAKAKIDSTEVRRVWAKSGGGGGSYTAGGTTYKPGGTYGDAEYSVPVSEKGQLTVNIAPRSDGFLDGKYTFGNGNTAILHGGNVVTKDGTDVRERVKYAVETEVERLGGASQPGVFFRGTNNPNEIQLLESGKLRNSKNHNTGESEDGVSVWDGMKYASHDYTYKVSGDIVGVGSDGEPILDPKTMKVVGGLKKTSDYRKEFNAAKKRGEKAFMDAYGWDKQQMEQATIGGYKKEDLESRGVKKSFSIYKTDDDKRLVFGWASIVATADGNQLEDRQHDIIDPEDLEEAAYDYVLNFRDTGEEHLPSMRKKGRLVESCVLTEEKQKAMGIPKGILPIGWWIGFYIDDDDTWNRIKNGTYQMFSIEGKANREPIGKAHHMIGCGVLVVRDGKILTGTRLDKKSRRCIGGPGGHIESGEDPEQAAIREAEEEFGIKCRNLIPLGTAMRNTSTVFLCTDFSGEPKADGVEMGDAKWMDLDELREKNLFPAFRDSLRLYGNFVKSGSLSAKAFSDVVKFNPFHDARGRFASSQGFKTYSANPKTKAGAMAIRRSAEAGHGTTFNSHKESKGENVQQNYNWLNGGPGAKQLGASGQLASQQAKKPQKAQAPKKVVNRDRLGFAEHDDAGFHQLHSGAKYYAQQKLTQKQKTSVDNYLESTPEMGSLYSHSQNMNWKMANGQPLTGKYKQTHDGIMSAMHNMGYNVNLTRYDHPGMVNSLLKAAGVGSNYENMSASSIKKALVGKSVIENKFLSCSYNDFQNAPAISKNVFTTRAVKINYKVRADTQAMMPGNGPGGKLGEVILAPTNGTSNRAGKITDVRLTGQMVRRKGTQLYNQPRIEIDIEI